MNIKKTAIALGLAGVLTLGACSGGPTEAPETSTPTEVQTVAETPSEEPTEAQETFSEPETESPTDASFEAQVAYLDKYFWGDNATQEGFESNASMCEDPSYAQSEELMTFFAESINDVYGNWDGETYGLDEEAFDVFSEWVEVTPEAATVWFENRCTEFWANNQN